jgi:hypothetical protein
MKNGELTQREEKLRERKEKIPNQNLLENAVFPAEELVTSEYFQI